MAAGKTAVADVQECQSRYGKGPKALIVDNGLTVTGGGADVTGNNIILRGTVNVRGDNTNIEKQGVNGNVLGLARIKTAEISLTAGGTTSTSTGWIPAGAVIGMSAKVTATLATGDRTTLALSSPTLSVTWMTKTSALTTAWNQTSLLTATPIVPFAKIHTAAEDLVFTISGGTTGNIPSGAKVRVTVYYLDITPATS